MGIAEFIIGPAEGRTRWLPSYALVHDPNLLFDDIISRAPARSKLRSKAAPSIESAERIWRAKPVVC